LSAPTLLIDADLLVYRNTIAVENDVRWDEQNHVLWSNEEDAWDGVMRDIRKLEDRFDPEALVFATTQGPNFRNAVDPSYKSNRANSRRPIAYAVVLAKLRAAYDVRTIPGLEADDVLGILATSSEKHTIVCSVDKDMQTIPCTLFNGTEVRKIDKAEADYRHLYQTLVGDTADGYPGCPGIGPVKAEKVLNVRETIAEGEDPNERQASRMWRAVAEAYLKAGRTVEDALKQARLARILRASDWDFEKREVILWTPRSS
jgi:5'-3' exonuclease